MGEGRRFVIIRPRNEPLGCPELQENFRDRWHQRDDALRRRRAFLPRVGVFPCSRAASKPQEEGEGDGSRTPTVREGLLPRSQGETAPHVQATTRSCESKRLFIRGIEEVLAPHRQCEARQAPFSLNDCDLRP